MGAACGPIAFATAWAVLGAGAGGYDPTRDAISRLAELGAPTRPAMTAGLLALAAGMGLYGLARRPDPVWAVAVANGLTALAVAGLPLGGRVDTAHGVAAALGYITLAAIPVVSARRLPPAQARAAVAAGAVCALCLVASALVERSGLFQRLGLAVAQGWVVVSAVGLLRSPTSSSTTPPDRAPAAPPR